MYKLHVCGLGAACLVWQTLILITFNKPFRGSSPLRHHAFSCNTVTQNCVFTNRYRFSNLSSR
ncbi:unnamed protein product [Periconia digitata]|uniref:Uncharacterized protein n=1 Tax=Periconia digitata TaxID=1303443 RepID=A0A9W4XHN3_9PLEO|nr:unnamed protein product [Periconia digitata]